MTAPKLRCKVGDVAIILRSKRNSGRIVRVLEMYEPAEQKWLVESLGSPFLVNRQGDIRRAMAGLIEDAYLLPLRDDDSAKPRSTSRARRKSVDA